jgi:hypothetical protein
VFWRFIFRGIVAAASLKLCSVGDDCALHSGSSAALSPASLKVDHHSLLAAGHHRAFALVPRPH